MSSDEAKLELLRSIDRLPSRGVASLLASLAQLCDCGAPAKVRTSRGCVRRLICPACGRKWKAAKPDVVALQQ